jgi:hypothetical protein
VAIGASFKQFEKSNGGACASLLDYRPLSHNQALEIDRLKHVLVESKGLAEIERIANLAASTVIRMSADCVPLRSLAAATTELGSFKQTKRFRSLCSTALLARPQVPAAKEFSP